MIGERIKELLKMKGMTQIELGQRAGISESHMSRIITGKISNPGHGSIEKMAEVLGVPVSAFYDEEIGVSILAQDILKELPPEIIKALADTREREWLLFGLSLRNKKLSLEEIDIILNSYQQVRDKIKR